MDNQHNCILNHLPVRDVTKIVEDYLYVSLINFFKDQYIKNYNREFKDNEEQSINESFFKVLDKCNSEYGGFTITITSNGNKQTYSEFKIESNKYKKCDTELIRKYNETLQISISYEDSCVLYLTDSNWYKYKQEEKTYKKILNHL